MLGMIRQAFRRRFPLPEPPKELTGQWTQDERQFVVDGMYHTIDHRTQGKFDRLPEDQKYDFRHNIRLVQNGTTADLNRAWPSIRMRYQVNAVLAAHSVMEHHQ